MPRSSRQKEKLLYLQKILLEKTDENHPLTAKEIIDLLAANDIQVGRKALYDDLEILQTFGLDICQTRDHTVRYFVGSRDFEIAELKLLVDAIQSSKFITHKKSLELIKKLEGLVSENDGRQLQREVVVSNRVKTFNEHIYYNVDEIHSAINENKKISFRYMRWDVDFTGGQKIVKKEKTFRRCHDIGGLVFCLCLKRGDHAGNKRNHGTQAKEYQASILHDRPDNCSDRHTLMLLFILIRLLHPLAPPFFSTLFGTPA